MIHNGMLLTIWRTTKPVAIIFHLTVGYKAAEVHGSLHGSLCTARTALLSYGIFFPPDLLAQHWAHKSALSVSRAAPRTDLI